MSAIATAARRLQAALGPVIDMTWPASTPIGNVQQAQHVNAMLSDLFMDLRQALVKEADDNGGDVSWLDGRDGISDLLVSGWETMVEEMFEERHDLAGATRAEARFELESGK